MWQIFPFFFFHSDWSLLSLEITISSVNNKIRTWAVFESFVSNDDRKIMSVIEWQTIRYIMNNASYLKYFH